MESDARNTRGELAGQVALVTGGGRGIGRAMARALAAAGAAVAVSARSADQLAETVAEITDAGGQVTALPVDVSDPGAVVQMVGEAEQRLGPLDLLVNNAAVGGHVGPIWEADPEEWWRCLEINLRGPFLCARAALPGMVARGRGRIVNVASGAGPQPVPYLSGYVTSKAALIRFTENLALEARPHGIRAFALDPGTVRTAMTEQALTSPAGQKWLPWFRDLFEQGRDVPPERAAQLVCLLASGKADALTGRFISVAYDVEELIARAEEIEQGDLYTLRLRGPR
jgi:NAD(P)-dependent dehydrogenase (short-subunit alcohol dehydrogenase family)